VRAGVRPPAVRVTVMVLAPGYRPRWPGLGGAVAGAGGPDLDGLEPVGHVARGDRRGLRDRHAGDRAALAVEQDHQVAADGTLVMSVLSRVCWTCPVLFAVSGLNWRWSRLRALHVDDVARARREANALTCKVSWPSGAQTKVAVPCGMACRCSWVTDGVAGVAVNPSVLPLASV